jgi:cytochrome P450
MDVRRVPGPRALPLLGATAHLLRFARDPLVYTERLFDTYGPIAALVTGRPTNIVSTDRTSPCTVFVYGPELNRRLLTEHDRFHKCALAGPLYPPDERKERTRPLTRILTGLFHVNGQEHRRQRRLMMPAFHKSRIDSYRDDMVRLTRSLLTGFHAGRMRDLRPDMAELTLAIAAKTLLGEDVAEQGVAIARQWHRWLELYRPSAIFPLDVPGSAYRAFLDLSRSIDEQATALIRARRAAPERGADILSMLLDATDESGAKLSDAEIVGHASVIFAAGHETSSNALCWTLLLLSQHPNVLSDVMDELDQVLKGEPPRVEELAALPLLERVVKESLRLLPPVPFNHRVAAEDTELGGCAIPRGSEIITSIYRTQRMPDVFADPTRYKPERWENFDPGPYSYNPFGAGPRMCIGASFAMMEVRIVLAMLLQAFRFELAPGARVDRFMSITMSPRPGLPMLVHRQDRRFDLQRPGRFRGDLARMLAPS